jgi:hypothetical protein
VSFVSLEKYLNGARAAGTELKAEAGDPFPPLAQDVLEYAEQFAFCGESLEDLAGQLRAIRQQLTAPSRADSLSSISLRVREIFRESRERIQKAEIERNQEFRNVLNMLSEALTHVSSRSERSKNTYKALEHSLQSASKLETVSAIRNRLSRVLEFIRNEEQLEKETGGKAENAIGTQLLQAQQSASRFRVRLLDRRQALHQIQVAAEGSQGLQGALFVCSQLQPIRVRHGNEICDDLIDELGRKELQDLAPGGAVYRWSPISILLLWKAENGSESREAVLRQLKPAYEHRALVGNRMATFRVAFKSLVTSLGGQMTEIAKNLDQFEKDVR